MTEERSLFQQMCPNVPSTDAMKNRLHTAAEFMKLVHEVDRDGEDLTTWEINFIAGYIDRSQPLQDEDITARMCQVLNRIRDERLQ